MKKIKQYKKNIDQKLSPEQALTFLDDFARLAYSKDKRTKLISLRVPENILELFKQTCSDKNQKYQSIIVKLMRDYLTQSKR